MERIIIFIKSLEYWFHYSWCSVFMKYIVMLAIVVTMPVFMTPCYGQTNNEKNEYSQSHPNHPNVIFIMLEGVGYGDLSSYGNKKLQTPNIDRLAREV